MIAKVVLFIIAVTFGVPIMLIFALISAVPQVEQPAVGEDYAGIGIGTIPANYLAAYQAAGKAKGVAWQVIAAIGWEETKHGTYLGPSGVLKGGCIEGPMTPYGTAKGPMQFLDSSWEAFGEDGNGDGISNQCDIRDAPFGTANHLKQVPGTLPINYEKSIYGYNHDTMYVARVLATAAWYGFGTSTSLGWYRYQGELANQPYDADVDCGPASVAMGIARASGVRPPIRSIRTALGQYGTYTSLSNLSTLLSHWNVPHRRSIITPRDIPAALGRGSVVIILVNMRPIAHGADVDGRSTDPALRSGQHTSNTLNHWIVLTSLSPDRAAYTVFDPNVWDPTGGRSHWYSNNTPKGRGRYFRADQVAQAMYASGGINALELPAPGGATQ